MTADGTEPFICLLMVCWATETKFVIWVICMGAGLAIMFWPWWTR